MAVCCWGDTAGLRGLKRNNFAKPQSCLDKRSRGIRTRDLDENHKLTGGKFQPRFISAGRMRLNGTVAECRQIFGG